MFTWNLSHFKYAIYLVYTTSCLGICSLSGFGGQHTVAPSPPTPSGPKWPFRLRITGASRFGRCVPAWDVQGKQRWVPQPVLPDPSLSQGQVEAVHDVLLSTSCCCPQAQLFDPDAVFPFRNTEEVREKVAEERRRLLHRDGTPRDRCRAEVCHIRCIRVIY